MRSAFNLVEQEITAGGRLGDALARQPQIPKLLTEIVAGGEQAGALRQNLEALADYYLEETDRRVQATTGLIEPAAFLVVGGIIGFIAVAVLTGIYSVIPAVSGDLS